MKSSKKSLLSRINFWAFVIFAAAAAFLFWSARAETFKDSASPIGINISLLSAVIATMLAIMFGIFTFIGFIRRKSIAGGLFLTTCIATAVFLGGVELVDAVTPQNVALLSQRAQTTQRGIDTVVTLAQIGLFALWFLFLLFTIYLYVSPVKRIDRVLGKIVEGENVGRVKIGNGRQYKGIEQKLAIISVKENMRREKETHKKQKARERREKINEAMKTLETK